MLDCEKRALAALEKCIVCDDAEQAHYDADLVLCDLLCELGYGNIVLTWRKIDKWYS